MIRRNTWILLGVFAVLLAAAVYLQRSGRLEASQEETTPTVEEQKLLDVQPDGIRSFQIADAQGKTVSVQRDAQGAWMLAGPQEGAADTARVDSALAGLAAFEVLNTLGSDLSLDVIGLAKPAYTLKIGLSDAGEHVIEVGNETPTGTGYYARMDGGAPVVVSKTTIDSAIELLTTPPVVAGSETVPAETLPPGSELPGSTESPGTKEAAGTSQPPVESPSGTIQPSGTPSP